MPYDHSYHLIVIYNTEYKHWPAMTVIGWIFWLTSFSASLSNSPASTTTEVVPSPTSSSCTLLISAVRRIHTNKNLLRTHQPKDGIRKKGKIQMQWRQCQEPCFIVCTEDFSHIKPSCINIWHNTFSSHSVDLHSLLQDLMRPLALSLRKWGLTKSVEACLPDTVFQDCENLQCPYHDLIHLA